MSVTAAAGFRAAGVAAGLKASGGPDVALVVNDGPASSAAGVFTANRVKAAPVLWSQQVLLGGSVRAVVLNSGGANACTGPLGFQDTHQTAERVAERLGCGAAEIAVCSTGLIGERLPLHLLIGGIDAAVERLADDAGSDAAEAIRTTDTIRKECVVDGDGFVVGGMAKGAGMLAPALATMLCVLTTDAVADSATLSEVLRSATSRTFDRVDTDGCMSTNDAVLLLASGASGRRPAREELERAVTAACAALASALVADAEGASKQIAIEVRNALSEDEAVEVGRAVARSALFKCAVHGADPNWGRVLAAIGTTQATFEPDSVDVAINGVWVCREGAAGEPRDLVDMSGRMVHVLIDLAAGAASACVHTTDLTADYVHENSAYST